MKRVAFGIPLTIILGSMVGAFGIVWLIWFSMTIVSAAIFRWKRLPAMGRRLTAAVMVLLLVVIMAFTGAVPNHYNPGSAATSRLPVISSIVSDPPALYARADIPPQLDELQQAKDDFSLSDFRLRSQKSAVERALSLNNAADGAIDFGQHSQLQITDLLDAKQSLDRTLDDKKLRTIDRLDEAKAALDKFLEKYEAEMARASTGAAARRVLTDFRLQSHDNSMDVVNDSVLRLESALNRIAKDFIGDQFTFVTYNQVRLDEVDGTLVRDESISFGTQNIAIKSIDASELMIARDADALSQDLLVFFGDDQSAAQKPTNVSDIPIRPGISKVTLLKRTVVSAELSDLQTRLRFRFLTFKRLFLKWPTVFPAKVRLILDLSSANLSAAYPYSVDATVDAAIKDLRMPVYSLFNAGVTFKPPRREGDEDVFETEAPLMPSYFLSHNYIWVELMPESIYFRNSKVQDWKQYLFPENLAAALVVMILGFICALVIA